MNPNGAAPRWTGPRPAPLSLRLYVAGNLPQSTQAIANLRHLCTLPAMPAVELEIVDILHAPARALEDGIVATPTLVRLAPAPVVRVLGALSDTDRVRSALGLSLP